MVCLLRSLWTRKPSRARMPNPPREGHSGEKNGGLKCVERNGLGLATVSLLGCDPQGFPRGAPVMGAALVRNARNSPAGASAIVKLFGLSFPLALCQTVVAL